MNTKKSSKVLKYYYSLTEKVNSKGKDANISQKLNNLVNKLVC